MGSSMSIRDQTPTWSAENVGRLTNQRSRDRMQGIGDILTQEIMTVEWEKAPLVEL